MVSYYLLMSISAVWLLSEILLAKFKSSARVKQSQQKDKGSIKFLWIVIVISITLGILTASRGIGFIKDYSEKISSFGLGLILGGLIIRWIAIISLKKYFTVDVSIQKDHQIKTDGLYQSIRHPAYLGSLLSFLGLGLAFSNWISTLVIFVPILAVFLLRIRVEEEALLEFFGEEYEKYRQRTKKLIPGIF
ncbi:MAG: isoprenylcysteine carboxylmethyltransferase family protein [Calditrichaeota bacterium]|nr:isoprenylcysteine carboxylmethyltransferase family protein [Calditrichota bacterium]